MNTKSMLLLAEVWGAALLSAAVAYQVHRPVVVAATQEPASAQVMASTPMATQEPAAIEPEVIVMAPESIVGHVARALPALPTPPPQPRDLSEMKCSTWTDLTQGAIGQQVRYCE